jgi:hypothetical protein
VILYYFFVFGVAYGHCHIDSVRFQPSKGIGGFVDPERSSSISREDAGEWVKDFLQRNDYEILQFTLKELFFYFGTLLVFIFRLASNESNLISASSYVVFS